MDRETLAILANIDADFSLADPALIGRGSEASALRCNVTMVNHNLEQHTVELVIIHSGSTVPNPDYESGQRLLGGDGLTFILPPAATNAITPALIELDVPADHVERVEIVSATLNLAGGHDTEAARRRLTPPSTGCNYVRPSAD
jgi:hypothetical protein